MELESDGMRLRRMLNPAPLPVLKSRSRACFWAPPPRLRIELAWPKASETPKPSMVWKVVPPLMATVDAALAGHCVTRTSVPAPSRPATATANRRALRVLRVMETSVAAVGAPIAGGTLLVDDLTPRAEGGRRADREPGPDEDAEHSKA